MKKLTIEELRAAVDKANEDPDDVGVDDEDSLIDTFFALAEKDLNRYTPYGG